MPAEENRLKLEILSSGYIILSELGRGSFSTVHLAVKRSNTSKVALKVLSSESSDESDLHFRLVHDNIISLYDTFPVDSGTSMVMVMELEYAKYGNLFHYVRAKARLNETQAKNIFADIVNGLCYLHKLRIAHRDLKPNNILIDEFHRAQIADLGHAKVYAVHNGVATKQGTGLTNRNACCSSADSVTKQDLTPLDSLDVSENRNPPAHGKDDGFMDRYPFVASPAYAAPEVLDELSINPMTADIWSLGVTLFYMVSGYLPFHGHSVRDIRQEMAKPLRWPRPLSTIAKPCRSLVKMLLSNKPSQRPTCNEIKQNNIWVLSSTEDSDCMGHLRTQALDRTVKCTQSMIKDYRLTK